MALVDLDTFCSGWMHPNRLALWQGPQVESMPTAPCFGKRLYQLTMKIHRIPMAKISYEVTLSVTDPGGLSTTKQVTVKVTNVIENSPPANLALSNNSSGVSRRTNQLGQLLVNLLCIRSRWGCSYLLFGRRVNLPQKLFSKRATSG